MTETSAGRESRGSRGHSSLWSGFLFALKVFLGVRIGLFVLGLLSPGLFPPLPPDAAAASARSTSLIDVINGDCLTRCPPTCTRGGDAGVR